MIIYLIKSSVCLFVLLALYHLLLEREKMHHFNRFYLLAAIVFSLSIPFASIEIVQQTAKSLVQVETLQPMTIINIQAEAPFNYALLIWILYTAIAIVLLMRFALNIRQLLLKKRMSITVVYQDAILVLVKEKCLPHTFLNWIFINKNDYENRTIEKELYAHELTHVTQKHSIDILFIELVKVVFWFNPILLYYKRAIQLNHEFLADQQVLTSFKDVTFYQQLLLSKADIKHNLALTSNLNYSLTKKRLLMMTKSSSTAVLLSKKIALLPLVIALVFLLCTKTVAQETKGTATSKQVTKESYYQKTVFKLMDKNGKIIGTKKYTELTPDQIKRLPAVPKSDKNGVTAHVTEWAIYANVSDAPKRVTKDVAKKTKNSEEIKFAEPKPQEIQYQTPTTEDPIFNAVTVKPDYPGGMKAFYTYVIDNFKVPAEVKESTKKLIVQFVVEKDGSLSNIKIVRDLGFGTAEEAIRVLKECPRWIPGQQDGETVRVMYSLPISFNMILPAKPNIHKD